MFVSRSILTCTSLYPACLLLVAQTAATDSTSEKILGKGAVFADRTNSSSTHSDVMSRRSVHSATENKSC